MKSLKDQISELNKQGKTSIFVAIDKTIEDIIAAADTIREESHGACKEL